MGIQVLGPLRLDGLATLTRRDRVVLGALALEHDRPVSAQRLAAVLWPEGPPASAAKVVQGCVARLRSEVGAERILTTDHGYLLDLTELELDLVQFENGVARGRELLALGQHDRAAYTLAGVLELWAGPPFPDLDHWDLAAIEASRLDELRLQAEELYADALLQSGNVDAALVRAKANVAESPLREPGWLLLARCAYAAGRQSEALAAIRRCRELLREELGLDPGPDLAHLEQQILQQDPALLTPAPRPTTSKRCPWPGLMAYDAEDAECFFGREAEVVSALALLHGRGVLAVVGPSGVGKSSLVRAGLLPVLRREGRSVAVLHPGAHPPSTLPTADVVFVDQAEELFGLCTSLEERVAFVDALQESARDGLLVISMRADRLADVAAYPELARLIEQGLYLLGALSERGLRSAIEKPVAQAGLRIEPGLVDVLLHELANEPGALPLLSHALLETWTRREGSTLTVDGYRASGGVRGAVAQSAEAVYGTLAPSEQETLRAVMLRLVSAGPEGEPLRARVPRRLVTLDPEQDRIVEQLVGSRLVTSDDEMLTLAHEALARAWPRLRDWLEDDVEGRRILHHLSSSADAWTELGRPDSELYRGVRLARALDWCQRSPVALAEDEEAFLSASERLAADDQRAAEARARQQVRVNRRLRVLVGGLVALVVVAVVAGLLALRQSQRAEDEALAADARRVGASALSTDDIPRALLLAVAGARLDPSSDPNTDLAATLAKYPQLIGTGSVPSRTSLSQIQVLDGSGSIAVSDREHHFQQVSLDTLAPEADYQAGGTQGNVWEAPIAHSRRADMLVVAATPASPTPLRLLDPTTFEELPRQLPGLPRQDVQVASLATSANGRYLAAVLTVPFLTGQIGGGLASAEAVVWDLLSPDRRVVARIEVPENFYNGVALSPDGKTLYLTNPVAAYDVSSGRRLWERDGGFDLLLAAQPSGHLVAHTDATNDFDVALADTRTGKVRSRLGGHDSYLTGIEFSHDGSMVAASAGDGQALVWDAGTGELLDQIEPGSTYVADLAFSGDDRTLYTLTGNTQQVQAWDLDGSRSFLSKVPLTRPVEIGSGVVRPDHRGRQVAFIDVGDDRPEVAIVDTDRDATKSLTPLAKPYFGAASWSPDDSALVLGYDDGWVQAIDVPTGRETARAKVLPGFVTEVAHSADDQHVVAADYRGNVVFLDSQTLDPVGTPVRVPENTYEVTAGPDGHSAFVLAGGTEWRAYWDVPITHWYLVDLEKGEITKQGEVGLRNAIYASFSPEGDRVAIGGRQGSVVLIDLETEQPVRPAVVGHQGDAYWVTYSADGSLVTSGSTAGDVAIWDGRTGELRSTAALPDQERAVSTAFRPDGSVLIASFTGNVYRWDPSREAAIAFACRAAGRELTRQEWSAELPDRPWRTVCS